MCSETSKLIKTRFRLATFQYVWQDSGDDGGALALEVANVEGVFLLLIVGSVAAILCSCVEMILDVLGRAIDNKVTESVRPELKLANSIRICSYSYALIEL